MTSTMIILDTISSPKLPWTLYLMKNVTLDFGINFLIPIKYTTSNWNLYSVMYTVFPSACSLIVFLGNLLPSSFVRRPSSVVQRTLLADYLRIRLITFFLVLQEHQGCEGAPFFNFLIAWIVRLRVAAIFMSKMAILGVFW